MNIQNRVAKLEAARAAERAEKIRRIMAVLDRGPSDPRAARILEMIARFKEKAGAT
jgi:hypothetical protein